MFRFKLVVAETERDNARAERDHYHDLWVAANEYRAEWQALAEEYRCIAQQRTAERDQYRQRANSAEARMGNYKADNRRLSEARVLVQRDNAELVQRAARLAALETAARAWAHDGSGRAESQLLDAVEALDGSAGEADPAVARDDR